MDIETQLEGFVKGAQAMIDEYNQKQNYPWKSILIVERGKKFARIVKKDEGAQGGSAWAFIDLTNGDILKPASWKAPAKHARGTIMEEGFGVKYVGPYGPAYLR